MPLYDFVIDCSQDFVPDVLIETKADATGRYTGATGISGVTMRLSDTMGGAAIHATLGSKATAERSAVAGQLYPTTAFEVADLQANLLPTYQGRIVYLVLDKAGDIVGKSLRCLVTANGVY